MQSDPIGLGGGINTYGYANAAPIMRTDPLGLWSANAHNYFLRQFASMHPKLSGQYGYLDQMQKGSRYADTMQYQTDQMSYMHAMSSRSLSPAQSQAMMCKYVKAYMGAYHGSATGPDSTGRRYFYLGMAMHAVMDSTSPAHKGFKHWGGLTDSILKRYAFEHGSVDFSPFSVESESDATDYAVETLLKMNHVMKGNYAAICCPN